MPDKIIDKVNKYYTQKIKEFGLTPKGVDWNSLESQYLRFKQLGKVIDFNEIFSVLDFGCGYGALFDFLFQNNKTNDYTYTGFDVSQEMINQALEQHKKYKNALWKTQLSPDELHDYTIASGIFNVKLETKDIEWNDYIIDTLITMNKHSKKGFSFNMLTSYSDKEFMRDYLYYADPGFFFDYCKNNFSKYVALLHNYPLYEFTIIVNR